MPNFKRLRQLLILATLISIVLAALALYIYPDPLAGRVLLFLLLGLVLILLPARGRMLALPLLAVAAGLGYGLHAYLGKEFSEDCRPCSDAAACRPIELSLELSQPYPRINTIYTVWHRVRLKNVSCLRLHYFLINQVRGSGYGTSTERLARRGVYFKVWDPQGREILPFDIPYSTPPTSDSSAAGKLIEQTFKESGLEGAVKTGPGRSEFGDVIPYQIGSKILTPSERKIETQESGFTDLLPGAIVESFPSVLAPYRTWEILVDLPEDKYGRVGSAFATITATAPVPSGVQPPPAGFQILRDYTFRTPGRYKMAVFFTGKTPSRFIRPNYDALSKSAYTILYGLSRVFGVEVRPSVQGPVFFIDAQSEVVEFEVTR